MRFLAVVGLVLLTLLVASPVSEGARAQDAQASNGGEVLVRFRKGFPRALQALPLASHARLLAPGVRYNDTLDVWRVPLRPGRSTEEALAELRADRRVVLAQPNYRYTNAVVPSDPLYAERQQPRMQVMNAPAGWDIETGSNNVVVAVIDGGVDIDHPELADSIWTNTAEIPGNDIDDDKNKCVDDFHGCNVQSIPPNGDVSDRDGHGTFVSGLIGANANNGEGIVGVAWNVTIMPVRALDPSGFGDTADLAQAILYAADNGADVINMSLALVPTGTSCPRDDLIEDALRVAHDDKGTTLVAAAGNFNVACVSYPGASEYTIAVSAAGPPGNPDARAFFSQWGPEVDVTAPGEQIVSTCPPNPQRPTSFCNGPAYGTGNGTSFSTPIVTGLAALLLAHDPTLTNEDVRARMRASAHNLPDESHANWDGAGMIDIAAALGAPSAHVVLGFSGPDAAGVRLRLTVGEASAPLCSATLWGASNEHARAVYGTFGVAECAAYWPPSPERPWRVFGQAETRKRSKVTTVALLSGKDSCSPVGLPVVLTPAETVITSINCDSHTLVPNDRQADATVIDPGSIPRRFDQDARYATSLDDPVISCATEYSSSVWYRIPASPSSGALAADSFGSTFDTVLAVFRDDGAALEEVGCNDQFEPGSQSRVVWRTESGVTYLLMAAALGQIPAEALRLDVSPAYPPANDSRESPLPLAFDPVIQGAHGATSDQGDPVISCGQYYGYSVWFAVDTTKGIHGVNTVGSDYDTVVAVFREEVGGALTEVACNDEAHPGVHTSFAAWDSDGGRYLVLVGAFRSSAARVLRILMNAKSQ